jgi:hypothetical protein
MVVADEPRTLGVQEYAREVHRDDDFVGETEIDIGVSQQGVRWGLATFQYGERCGEATGCLS